MKFPNFSGTTPNFSGGVNNQGGTAVVIAPPSLVDSFEYSGNWPGTVPDINYYLSYSFTPTNVEDESFEIADGW